MKKLMVVPVILGFFTLFSVPLLSAKVLPANYVSLKLGGFFPLSGDLNDINADAGFNGEIALGHNIAPGFSVEGGIGYYDTKGEASTPFGGVEEKFEVIPLTVSLRGQVPYGRFEPYGFVGMGVYFIKDKLSIPTLGSDSDKDTDLGFHIGLGGNYTLPNNMFLGIEARYLFLKTNTFDADTRLDGIIFTGNVGYRF